MACTLHTIDKRRFHPATFIRTHVALMNHIRTSSARRSLLHVMRGARHRFTDDHPGDRERAGKGIDAIARDARDRLQDVIEKRPLAIPLAAAAIGVGIGALWGSKLARFVVLSAIGGAIADSLSHDLQRITRDVIDEMRERLDDVARADEPDEVSP